MTDNIYVPDRMYEGMRLGVATDMLREYLKTPSEQIPEFEMFLARVDEYLINEMNVCPKSARDDIEGAA